jgi:hypothetical protein
LGAALTRPQVCEQETHTRDVTASVLSYLVTS